MNVVEVIKAHGGSMEAADIADAAGMSLEAVYSALVRAYDAGQVRIYCGAAGRFWECMA